MGLDLFSDEAIATARQRYELGAADWAKVRADAWKEISAHHQDLAVALVALRAEFPISTLPSDEIRKFAAAWRARPENQRKQA